MGEIALETFPFARHDYVIRNLTVPNMRNGALDLPQMTRRNPDAIPIWAGFTGDEVVMRGASIPHPKQERQWRIFLEGHDVPDSDIDAMLRDIANFGPVVDSLDEKLEAVVITQRTSVDIPAPSIGKNPKRHLSGRPLMVLNMGKATSESAYERASPATLGHEITHVIQNLHRPVDRVDTAGDEEDLSLRRELEAYFTEIAVIEGLAAIHYQRKAREAEVYTIDSTDGFTLSQAAIVHNITMEVNAKRKDRFFPDGKIRKQLAELGVRIHLFDTNNTGRHLSIKEYSADETAKKS